MSNQAMFRKGLLVFLGALGLLAAWLVLASQAAPQAQIGPAVAQSGDLLPALTSTLPVDLTPHRAISGTADAPTISFIDSPSATCYQPVPSAGMCYVTWNYLYVNASTSQYIISMTVNIDGAFRAYHSGFFQTAMYIPGDLYGPGFLVTCGLPGSGGNPNLGMAHSYTVRARETGGLTAANYGSVYCPAFTPPPTPTPTPTPTPSPTATPPPPQSSLKVYLPVTRKR
jgi:hypothetical protein